MQKRNAFTLIELSIVLVIIGLIVGGILVGQDLIWAAQNRKITAQMEAYKQAYLAFRLKYDCLPGDCTNTSTFFSGLPNGDGDRRIEWNTNEAGGSVWESLERAGLIDDYVDAGAGKYYHQSPLFPSPARVSFYYMNTGWHTLISAAAGQPNLGRVGNSIIVAAASTDSYLRLSTMMADRMFAIDTKVDDGLPLTGGFSGVNAYIDFAQTTLGACVDIVNNVYLFGDTEKSCNLVYFLD